MTHVLNKGEIKKRFLNQIILKNFGWEGQESLFKKKVLIVGLGATGSIQAEVLTRMGVGEVRIIDPDIIEEGNLHRQILYHNNDVGLFKAEVAERYLSSIHPHTKIIGAVGRIEDLWQEMARGADLILDGTDCMRTRFFLNDLSIFLGIPWIFTGVAGDFGQSVLLSPSGPCLRCMIEEPKAGLTCGNEGVYPTAAIGIGTISAHTAIKYLLGVIKVGKMIIFDMGQAEMETITIEPNEFCPAHVNKKFEYLKSVSE